LATPPAVSREARIEALRTVYSAAGDSDALFSWATSELLGHLAASGRGGAPAAWPGAGFRNGVVRRLGGSRPTAWLGERLLRARSALRPPPGPAPAPTSPPIAEGAPRRVAVFFGAANERRILAWREAARPLPTVVLAGPSDPPESAGAVRGALRAAVEESLRRTGRASPRVALSVRATFHDRVRGFLGVQAALDAAARAGPVDEILVTTTDERALGACAWSRRRGGPRVVWVQHGFLATDVLPWLPGAEHHGYAPAYAEFARATGAPADAIASPLGLAYVERVEYEPRRTILAASQGTLPFSLPVGRGAQEGYGRFVEAAVAAGWDVVRRPHRIEAEGFEEHALPGVRVERRPGTLAEHLEHARPAMLVSVWSTAALDALASGCLPVFVASRSGAREHAVDSLEEVGLLLDPTEAGFADAVRTLLARSPDDLRAEALRRAASLARPGATGART
jgi:hypothetical protein